jgi:hypothetical protein
MGVNLNALYLIEERLIHAFGRSAKRANLKRSDSEEKKQKDFYSFVPGQLIHRTRFLLRDHVLGSLITG